MKLVTATYVMEVEDCKADSIMDDIAKYGINELVAAGFVKVVDVEKKMQDIIHYDADGAHIVRGSKSDFPRI